MAPSSPASSAATSPSRRAAAMPAEQRRAAIVEATLPLFSEYGERVTTRQVAEAAGIAEGTIFRVFADKDELLSVVLEAALDMGELEELLAGIDPHDPFETQLLQATEMVQQRVADVWRVVSNLGPALRAQASRPFRDSPGLIALFERQRQHVDVAPAEASRLLRALILAMTHPLVAGDPMPAQRIVDIFLHGVERR